MRLSGHTLFNRKYDSPPAHHFQLLWLGQEPWIEHFHDRFKLVDRENYEAHVDWATGGFC
jgi:hypothetical protein